MDDLAVIDVELQLQVRDLQFLDQIMGEDEIVEEVTGHVGGLIGSITTSSPSGAKNSAAVATDLQNAATAFGSARSAIPAIRCTRLTPVACA